MSEPTPFKNFVTSPVFVSDVVEIFPFTYVHVFSMKYVSQRVACPPLAACLPPISVNSFLGSGRYFGYRFWMGGTLLHYQKQPLSTAYFCPVA